MALKGNYLVTKKNAINELRAKGMSLQELRFFTIYLSKINPKDKSTRRVKFSLEEFRAIMQLGRINIKYLRQVTDSLLSKIITIPDERGGYTSFQLFQECSVTIQEDGKFYVEIDAHNKALPMLFDFKNQYFSYQLWNALRLKSSHQLRMYEILKQYERVGERIMTVEELRALLGVEENEYKRFNDFKVRILESCKIALTENTDIKFTYEPFGPKGKGGKILKLRFVIEKNEGYKEPLGLDEFIDLEKETIIWDVPSPETAESSEEEVESDRIEFLRGACGNEFTRNEMLVLHHTMKDKCDKKLLTDELTYYAYLKSKYDELNMRAEKTKINNRFAYMKKLIGT